MIFLLYFFILLTFLVLVFFIISYFLTYQRMLLGEAPFVPVPAEFLPQIIETLDIREGSVLYDLGCGDGRILFAGAWNQPKASFVGYEKSFVVYLCAWIRRAKLKKQKSVALYRKDFFSADLSQATHVFTYLMPKMMKKLEPKFAEELAPGTRLVSCSFSLKGRNPDQTIQLKSDKILAPSVLYVYNY